MVPEATIPNAQVKVNPEVKIPSSIALNPLAIINKGNTRMMVASEILEITPVEKVSRNEG